MDIKNKTELGGKGTAVLIGVILIISTFFFQGGFKEILMWIFGALLIWLGIKD